MQVIIIGAGFGGIGMAITLKQQGYDSFVVLEKAADLGGVWRENIYPGAACDAPSHLYSYSFESNYEWSRKFAPQPEILAYIRHCAKKYGVESHIRFNSEVTGAEFDDQSSIWNVRTKDGRTTQASILISAVGQLHNPSIPNLPGPAAFAGKSFHSAQWDQSWDLTGRSVAVIGTGSSAIQIVPAIADKVRQLYVFQRSPGYFRPKPDRPYDAIELARLRRYPIMRLLDRAKLYCQSEARFINFSFPPLNRRAQRLFNSYLEQQVKDEALRNQITPSYAVGCKRGLPTNDWLPTLLRDNVELVTTPVSEVVQDGIRTQDGKTRLVDTIIYATGFKATQFLAPMRIRGSDGKDLHDIWADGAEAYLGITVSGFPNMFLIYGPNTNLPHSPVLYMLESQFQYIGKCLDLMFRRGLRRMDVRPEAQARYNASLQRRLQKSVMTTGGCTSWFKTAAGKVTTNWPSFSFMYRLRTRWLKPRDYRFEKDIRASG